MWFETLISLCAITVSLAQSFDSPPLDWVDKDESGAYQFGYATGDEGKHYHVASATANNMVSGRFGFKDPVTGGDLQTVYTAGRKGFRARGPHIARRMDLSQNRPPFSRPNNDGKYIPELDNVFDPNEDRGYDFSYRTPTHVKEEHADRGGNVQGRYSYVDDVGNRHTVEYIAGSGTGFVVTNAVPDTFARARGGPLYYVGNRPDRPKIRGFHAIQKALDGSYRFEASGPDQKRSEVSDAVGNRRGTYTYLDDKGIQHTVEYIAGPNIGFKIVNNKKGTAYNPVLPFFPDSPTIGPFAPSFPTTTLRPIITSPSFPGGSGSSTSFGGSGSGGGSSFSVKPTEATKFPVGPTGPTPGHQSSTFPGDPSDSTSPRPAGLPDSSYGFPGQPPSSSPGSSSHLAPESTEAAKFPTPGPTKPTTPFTSSSGPDSASNFGDTDKWNYNVGHGANNPVYPHSKDWSMHTKQESGKKPRPGIPASFPFFKPSLPGEFEPFHHSFIDDGLNTAESGSGAKPSGRPDCSANGTFSTGGAEHSPSTRTSKSHYRGSIKFGGIRRSQDDKEKREEYLELPPGVAVRAHVQSLDIVPYNKRFASPGEALEAFSKHKGGQ